MFSLCVLFSLSKNFRALAQIGGSDIASPSTREVVKPKELNLANVFYLIFYLIWLLLYYCCCCTVLFYGSVCSRLVFHRVEK